FTHPLRSKSYLVYAQNIGFMSSTQKCLENVAENTEANYPKPNESSVLYDPDHQAVYNFEPDPGGNSPRHTKYFNRSRKLFFSAQNFAVSAIPHVPIYPLSIGSPIT
ncbi:unnamed protein product, partial [Porites lobata]